MEGEMFKEVLLCKFFSVTGENAFHIVNQIALAFIYELQYNVIEIKIQLHRRANGFAIL